MHILLIYVPVIKSLVTKPVYSEYLILPIVPDGSCLTFLAKMVTSVCEIKLVTVHPTCCTIAECTCGYSSRSDKCCTKSALLKTIPFLANQDSVFVELSDSTTSCGSSKRLFLALELAYFAQRSNEGR